MSKSYEERVAAAKQVIADYNTDSGTDSPFDADQFEKALKTEGYTDVDSLDNDLTWEDVRDELGINKKGVAKKVRRALRGGVDDSSSDAPAVPPVIKVDLPSGPITKETAGSLPLSDVIKALKLGEVNGAGEYLREQVDHAAFIVPNDNNTGINYEKTEKVYLGIKNGDVYDGEYEDEDGYYVLLEVGEKPEEARNEHPLFANEHLNSDGKSPYDKKNWMSLPLEVRQYLRVAYEADEIEVDEEDKAERAKVFVLAKKGLDELKEIYDAKKAWAARKDDLPKLVSKPSAHLSDDGEYEEEGTEGDGGPFHLEHQEY